MDFLSLQSTLTTKWNNKYVLLFNISIEAPYWTLVLKVTSLINYDCDHEWTLILFYITTCLRTCQGNDSKILDVGVRTLFQPFILHYRSPYVPSGPKVIPSPNSCQSWAWIVHGKWAWKHGLMTFSINVSSEDVRSAILGQIRLHIFMAIIW